MSAGYEIPPPTLRPRRVCDYGCGDGWYLERLRDLGHEVVGFEPAPGQAAQLAGQTGLKVFANRDEMFSEAAGRQDLVTMHFVLEHVTNLHDAFEDAGRLLSVGGRLHVLVPCMDAFGARLFGRFWHGLDAPRHVSFPDARILQRLGAIMAWK